MSRIIINTRDGISDSEALSLVSKVVELGKISETKRGKQYCFLVCDNGTGIDASCRLTSGGTSSFVLYRMTIK